MIWYILWRRELELLGKKGGNTHFLTSVASASCYSLHNKFKSIILDAVPTPLTSHVTILWCPDDCPADGLGGLSVCLSVRWERKVDFGLICLEASNYIIIQYIIVSHSIVLSGVGHRWYVDQGNAWAYRPIDLYRGKVMPVNFRPSTFPPT